MFSAVVQVLADTMPFFYSEWIEPTSSTWSDADGNRHSFFYIY